jgi:hypothetical protein
VVRRTTENLEATAAVLRDLNAHLLVAGLSDDEARELLVQIDALTLSRMEISTWHQEIRSRGFPCGLSLDRLPL